jgi:hypothetical protein
MVPAALSLSARMAAGLRADVQDQVVVGHLAGRLDGGRRIGGEGLGADHVHGDGHLGAAGLHGLDHRGGLAHQVRLGQALADLQARGQQEGVGDAAADDQAVDLARQALQDGQLGADLGAGDDGHQRPLGVGQGLGDGVDLGGQQRAGAGHLGVLGDAVGGALGAVGGAEGVVDVDVAQGGHLLRQLGVVLLLADVDAAVLQQHDLAGATSTPSTQFATSFTSRPSSSDRRAATGASESSGLNSPSVGRPRWEVTITAAPACRASSMQGTEARMRVSSVMRRRRPGAR